MIRASGQVRSNARRALPASTKPSATKATQHIDDFYNALESRDFSKAVAILEVFKEIGQPVAPGGDFDLNSWLAYAAFHMGDYPKALEVYKEILAKEDADASNHLYKACCLFCMGEYEEARRAAQQGPKTTLQNRLLFHIAFKLHDEDSIKVHSENIQETVEDQLSLAAMHFARTHYQEAADVYKRVLVSVRDYNAINCYIAQCYNKMDYYDFSNDVLNVYLQGNPTSASAINLRACNHFRLFTGKAAEAELKVLVELQATAYNVENPIITHNLVVFRGGENALQVLPPLIGSIPEARLNLVVFHLRNDSIMEAYELVKGLTPRVPSEFILKGVVCAMVGQHLDAKEPIQEAQHYFNTIGTAPSEKDTIPGRQCMAQQNFLMKRFDEVVKYLSSIKMYFTNDDTFNYMYGIALAATSNWTEAEEVLAAVESEKLRGEFSYTSWLMRSHIMARHPKKAWDLYLKMETTPESFVFVQLIAADCYAAGAFYYACRAYDFLERIDPSQHNWEGKRGASIGVFQQVIAGKEPHDSFWDVIKFLDSSVSNHAQDRPKISQEAQRIQQVMKDYARDNNIRRR